MYCIRCLPTYGIYKTHSYQGSHIIYTYMIICNTLLTYVYMPMCICTMQQLYMYNFEFHVRRCLFPISKLSYRLLHTDSDSDAWGSLNIKTWSYQFRIPIIKIRRSQDRLIFIMEIPISGKTVFLYWDGDLVPNYKFQRVYVNTSLWTNDSY